jgi:hypothetical protein
VISVLKALPYGFANLAIGKIDQVVRIQEAGAGSRFAKSNHKQRCSGGIRKRSRGSLQFLADGSDDFLTRNRYRNTRVFGARRVDRFGRKTDLPTRGICRNSYSRSRLHPFCA